MKYKNIKLFDCQDMPDDVRKKFFEYHGRSNDISVEHFIYSENEYCSVKEFDKLNIADDQLIWKEVENGNVSYNVLGTDIISDWLHANGAKLHEDVLVKHWW